MSPVVELSCAIGIFLGVGSSSLDIPLVPLSISVLVVWSRPCQLQFMSLVGGSGPVLLRVGLWSRVGI